MGIALVIVGSVISAVGTVLLQKSEFGKIGDKVAKGIIDKLKG
jgi:hypothetical protein